MESGLAFWYVCEVRLAVGNPASMGLGLASVYGYTRDCWKKNVMRTTYLINNFPAHNTIVGQRACLNNDIRCLISLQPRPNKTIVGYGN